MELHPLSPPHRRRQSHLPRLLPPGRQRHQRKPRIDRRLKSEDAATESLTSYDRVCPRKGARDVKWLRTRRWLRAPGYKCRRIRRLRFRLLLPGSTENKSSPKDKRGHCVQALLRNSAEEIVATRNKAL